MKKLLVILFALGLVFSFTAPVMATDVSFTGEYRIRGWYDSNSQLLKNDAVSSAFYDQRFRLQGVFQVAEGLSVTVRGDAMEGTWGDGGRLAPDPRSPGNIMFDYAYATFMTGIGQVKAGYMADGAWGTTFGDSWATVGTIQFQTKLGEDIAFLLKTTKVTEGDKGFVESDRDDDGYVAALVYLGEGINGGLLYKYYRLSNMAAGLGYNSGAAHALIPYVNATFGDLYVEAELAWADGEAKDHAFAPLVKNTDLEGLAYYMMAKYNLGSAYVGGLFAYVQGDDPTTPWTSENARGMINSGTDWDPMLILFNDNYPTTVGTGPATGMAMDNGSIYQVFAGTAIDKLSLKASLAMAKADEPLFAGQDDSYGTELDVTAAYRIYDNLTYTVGFGYLWAGDYYKGTSALNKIDNTYLSMNRLQVNF